MGWPWHLPWAIWGPLFGAALSFMVFAATYAICKISGMTMRKMGMAATLALILTFLMLGATVVGAIWEMHPR